MAQKTYTIGEASRIVGVEVRNNSTLRLWTQIFADWLSPLTRPQKGQLRLYTHDDLKTLMSIRDLRSQHVPYEEIRKKLAVGETGTESEMRVEPAKPSQEGAKPVEVASIAELREVLAPVFQVSRALERFVVEADVVGFQADRNLLLESMEALNERLGMLQRELADLRLRASQTAPPAGKDIASSAGISAAANRPDAVQSAAVGRPNGRPAASESSEARLVSPARSRTAPGQTGEGGVTRRHSANLNEYGLRPLPSRLLKYPLGSLYLCRDCGSSTSPLGMTPTARVVFACMECGERAIVPLDDVGRALGLKRGLWSRFWGWLKRPFSRQGSQR